MFVSGLSHAPRAGFQVAIGSGTEKPPNVLENDERRTQHAYRAGDIRPDAGPVAFPQALTCPGAGHVLARESGAQDVHGFDCGPVGLADVAEVGHVREAVGEDGRRSGVVVRHPSELAADDGLDGRIQAAVAGAETADP